MWRSSVRNGFELAVLYAIEPIREFPLVFLFIFGGFLAEIGLYLLTPTQGLEVIVVLVGMACGAAYGAALWNTSRPTTKVERAREAFARRYLWPARWLNSRPPCLITAQTITTTKITAETITAEKITGDWQAKGSAARYP